MVGFYQNDIVRRMNSEESKVRVLIVEDHPFVRDGLVSLLNSRPEYEVIAECETIAQALTALELHRPQLVIADLRLPDGDGVTLLDAVQGVRWETYAVVLSAFAGEDDQVAASRAGARAFLLKTARGEEILGTLQRVMDGENVLLKSFSPALKSRLNQRDLTPRELDVLGYLGRGLSNKEICTHTGAAENTIKVHLRRIFMKLGVSNRTEAASIAVRRGLTH